MTVLLLLYAEAAILAAVGLYLAAFVNIPTGVLVVLLAAALLINTMEEFGDE